MKKLFFLFICFLFLVHSEAKAKITFSTDDSSTYDVGDDGSTWTGPILKMSASTPSSSTGSVTFTVRKYDGSTFTSSGTMYLMVGSSASGSVVHATKSVTAGASSVTLTDTLSDYELSSDSYPKDFYARYESSAGGYTTVGPITFSYTISAPTVTATGPESLDISWDSISWASYYRLYRATSRSGTYVSIYAGTSTSYTDDSTSLNPETTYYYKVVIMGADSTWSEQSYSSAGSDTTWEAIPDAPDAPDLAVTGSSTIDVDWNSVSGATSYKLYRATSSSGSYTNIYTGSSSSYSDSGLTEETKYYYKVKAGNDSGWSDYSSITSGTTEAETVILEKAVEGFLTLPLTDSNPYIYQGWTYNTIEISGSTTHEGIDFYCEERDPIVAAADGVAMVAYGGGYGYFIRILHDNGMETMYGHLSSYISSIPYMGSDTAARNNADYETWAEVTRGQTIGYCGSTETGIDHLHFELTTGGYGGSCGCRVDPYDIYNIDSYYPDFDTDSGASCGENSYWTSCPPVNSDSSDGGSDTSGSSTGSDSGSDTSGDSSDSYYYASSSYSTNDPDSSDTWHNVLRLDVSITGDEGTFVVTKFDSSDDSFGEDAFGTSGTFYLLTDSYDPSEGTIQDEQEIVSTGCGEGGTVKSVVLRANFTGSSSKNYYVRYEASSGGYTTVGPIAINYGVETTSSPYVLSSTSTENDPDSSDTYHGVLRMDVSIANKTAVFTITKSTTTSFSSEGTMYLQVGEDDEYIFDYYANDSESIDPTCDDSSVTGDTITSVVLTRDLSGFGESDFPKTYYARFGDSAYTVVGPVTITYSASLGKVSSTDGGSSSSGGSSTTGSSSSGGGGSSPGSGGGGSSSTAGGSSSSDSGSTTGSSTSGEDLTDSDSDGVLDSSDLCASTNPLDSSDTTNSDGCSLSQLDTDSDSLSDYSETVTYGTNPNNSDTDADGLSDYEELAGDFVTKLTASDGVSEDYFGRAVAISEDVFVVGTYANNSVSVYRFDGTSWNEEATLAPSDGSFSRFGYSVAISDDVIVVGGVSDPAYVYRYNGTSWNQEATLTPSISSSYFGISVSIDGDVIAVGTEANRAFVYRYNGSSWSEEKILTASDGVSGDYFGYAVSVSSDSILVGAHGDDDYKGSAYVYHYESSSWTEEAKLTASDAKTYSYYGWSVSIDGDSVLVGTNNTDTAYMYRYNGSSWEETKINASNDVYGSEQFGSSVAVKGDFAVIGAYGNYLGTSSGSAYLYHWDGSSWNEEKIFTASDGEAQDYFGYSVSVSNNFVGIGASQEDDTATNSGSAYIYTTVYSDVSDPADADTDDDGIADALDSSPINPDRDGDGSLDGADIFPNDATEWLDADSDGVGDNSDAFPTDSSESQDSDGDGLGDHSDPYPLSTDNDADGYVDTDCDNLNATIYPGATETCGDSIDQDCDGSDLECDTDGDGVGDSSDLCVSTGPLNSSDTINSNGCYLTELDSDSDGLSDYEETVDESSFRTTEIKPSVETTSSRFGFSVATDGKKLLTGNPMANGKVTSSGTATIYSWENGAWEAEAELMASDGTTLGNFGYSVSLDGDVALIGARGNDSGTTTGYAYIYRYDGTTWNQEAKLTPSDGRLKDMFGWSVSLSGDVAVVGTYYNRGSTSSTVVGSAYVYRYDGSTWNEETKLTASDGEAGDMFGKSVSINGDAILVGSHKDDDKATDAGAAYVYRYNGSSWDQEAKLTASDGTGTNYFGYSVSLDEDKAVVGAYLKSSNGAAYVFDFDGTSWSQKAKLKASDGAGYDNFGLSVSISGTSVVVGAWQDDDFGTSSGSAYVFTTDGSSWTQKEKLTPSSGEAGDYLGYSVAVRDDLVLVGAYGRGIGSAFVYDYADPVLTDPYDADTDDDGILDGADSDPLVAISDEDTDGVPDSSDLCASTSPLGTDDTVDADGCSLSQLDSDSDSLSDYADPYPLSADNDADGYTTTDCNNLDSSIYPGVFDTCGDSIDQDCDGADRECDSDGDGQESTVDGGEDCKDDDATIYNGASETCGDGLDQDCDGLDKECSVTYTVTSTDDANDGKCNTSHCSLREALSLSKTDTSALTVNVVFSIPSTDTGCSSGVCTISPTKALPSLTRGNTVVDGGGLIVIDGTSAGSTTKGFTINDSSTNVIKNLTIQNFGSHGIYVTGTTSSDNEISGCYIGVDSSGTDQSNGGSGIYIGTGSALISGNTIAYNALKGVQLSGTTAVGIIITQNSLHDNVSTGIVLASGANNTKAKPVITSAKISGTTVTITGTATAGDTIEAFVSSTDDEGKTYIGKTTADSSGNWSLATTTSVAPKDGKVITTATDSTNGTSQFSATKTVK